MLFLFLFLPVTQKAYSFNVTVSPKTDPLFYLKILHILCPVLIQGFQFIRSFNVINRTATLTFGSFTQDSGPVFGDTVPNVKKNNRSVVCPKWKKTEESNRSDD